MATVGYTTDTALTAYATARGITISGNLDQLLTRALDWVESQRFQGEKTGGLSQTLQWPRKGVIVDGQSVPDDVIPDYAGGGSIIAMQLETALAIDAGADPLSSISSNRIKSERVDVIEVEYQDGAVDITTSPKILNAGHKLLSGGTGSSNIFMVNS